MQPSTPKDTTHDEAKKFIEEIYRDLHSKGELIYSYKPGIDIDLFYSLIKAEFPCLLYQNHFRLKVYLNSYRYRVDYQPVCLVRNVYARLYNEKIMHLDFGAKYCDVDQIFQYIKEEFPNLDIVMGEYKCGAVDDVMRITITFKKEQIPIQKEKESLAFQKEKERIINIMDGSFKGCPLPFRLHVTECNKELISEIEKLYPDFEFCHVANSLLIDKKGHKERVVALIVKEIKKLRSGGIDAMVYIAHIMNVKSIVQEMKEKYPFIGFKVEGEYSLCLSPINEQYESEKQTLTEAVKKGLDLGGVQSIEKDYPQVEFKVICNAVGMARKEEPSHCDGKTHIEKMEKIQLEQLKKLLCIGTETYKYKVHLSHEKWEFGKVTKKNIEVLKEYGYKTHQGLTGLSLEWEV